MIGTLLLSAWVYLTFLTVVELPHLIAVNVPANPDPSLWDIVRVIARPAIDAWQDSGEDGALISSDGMSVASALAVAVVAGLGTATRRAHEVGSAAQPHESDEQAKLISIERSLLVQSLITMAVIGGLCVAIASRIAHGASGQTLLLPSALLVWLVAETGAPQDVSFARPARAALRRRATLRTIERQDAVLLRWDVATAAQAAGAFCMLNAFAMILPGSALRSAWANLSAWFACAVMSAVLVGILAVAAQIGLSSHRRWAGWFLTVATASFVMLTVLAIPATRMTSDLQFALHGLWSLTWIAIGLGLLGWPTRSPSASLSSIAAWTSRQLNTEGRVRLAVPPTCVAGDHPEHGQGVRVTVDGRTRRWRRDEEGYFVRARAGQRVELRVLPRSRLSFDAGKREWGLRVVDVRHLVSLVCTDCVRAEEGKPS